MLGLTLSLGNKPSLSLYARIETAVLLSRPQSPTERPHVRAPRCRPASCASCQAHATQEAAMLALDFDEASREQRRRVRGGAVC